MEINETQSPDPIDAAKDAVIDSAEAWRCALGGMMSTARQQGQAVAKLDHAAVLEEAACKLLDALAHLRAVRLKAGEE